MDLIFSKGERTLGGIADAIGPMAMTMLDDAFLAPSYYWRCNNIPSRPFITGENVRDWQLSESDAIANPYDSTMAPKPLSELGAMKMHFRPYRKSLEARLMFGKTQLEAGFRLYGYRYVDS